MGCHKFKHRMCGNDMCMKCCGSNTTIKHRNAAMLKNPTVLPMCEYHVGVRTRDRQDGEELLAQLDASADTNGARRKLGSGVMQESSFKFVGETATLFCANDFFKNVKFSKDVLVLQTNEQRKKRRDAQRNSSFAKRR
mgnify:FL=1